jgi:hypothetical protein
LRGIECPDFCVRNCTSYCQPVFVQGFFQLKLYIIYELHVAYVSDAERGKLASRIESIYLGKRVSTLYVCAEKCFYLDKHNKN